MQVDTSESLRNLQQEIESLLAPLTPLPDLEQVDKLPLCRTLRRHFVEYIQLSRCQKCVGVPQVGQRRLEKGLMRARQDPLSWSDSSHSHPIISQSLCGLSYCEMQVRQEEEDWSLVQSGEMGIVQKERVESEKEEGGGQIQENPGKEAGVGMIKDGIESNTKGVENVEEKSDKEDNDKAGLKEDCKETDKEVESSDTEPEESEERERNLEKEDCIQAGKDGALEKEKRKDGEASGDGSSWTVRLDKEIKDLENSAIASSRYLSHGLGLEDSLKNIENSLKSTQNRIAGYSRGEAGREAETKDKVESREKEEPAALKTVDGAERVGGRRETTPPSIALALKEAANMREEAKRR